MFLYLLLLYSVVYVFIFHKTEKTKSMRKMSIEIVYLLENSYRILTDVTFRFSNHRHVFLTLTSSFSLDSLSLALDSAIKKQHTSTTVFTDVYVNVTFLAHSLALALALALAFAFALCALKFSPTVTRIEVMICSMHAPHPYTTMAHVECVHGKYYI